MNTMAIESFIDFCDDMMIPAQEGFFNRRQKKAPTQQKPQQQTRKECSEKELQEIARYARGLVKQIPSEEMRKALNDYRMKVPGLDRDELNLNKRISCKVDTDIPGIRYVDGTQEEEDALNVLGYKRIVEPLMKKFPQYHFDDHNCAVAIYKK